MEVAPLAHSGITRGPAYEDSDLDADSDVDLADLAGLLAVYGTHCLCIPKTSSGRIQAPGGRRGRRIDGLHHGVPGRRGPQKAGSVRWGHTVGRIFSPWE
jgi:hypothetical protein